MIRKVLITLGLIAIISFMCSICFFVHLKRIKQEYTEEVQLHLNAFLHQQTVILSRLGSSLIPVLEQNDYKQLAELLAAYEEIIYAHAQQRIAVPFSVQYVSLNVPQKIIGSFGELDAEYLASDQVYYTNVVDSPHELVISKFYTKADMPDYPMVNLGLGISDTLDKFYGQLDLKLALSSLHNYLQSKIHSHTELFDFEFNQDNFSRPKINMHIAVCWTLFAQYLLLRVLLISAIVSLIIIIRVLWKRNKDAANAVLNSKRAIQALHEEINYLRKAQAVQLQYGLLRAQHENVQQTIILQSLLSDVKCVNVDYAIQKSVKIELPYNKQSNLRIYGNKLKLMQVLSGILYEMIWLLGAEGVIRIQVNISEQQNQLQVVEFIFSDNGYYDKLVDREVDNSVTDVRCYGWSRINTLVYELNGSLEYLHTAYTGNTIRFCISNTIANNVVKLEEYLQEV